MRILRLRGSGQPLIRGRIGARHTRADAYHADHNAGGDNGPGQRRLDAQFVSSLRWMPVRTRGFRTGERIFEEKLVCALGRVYVCAVNRSIRSG
jgi:hypothetical protein